MSRHRRQTYDTASSGSTSCENIRKQAQLFPRRSVAQSPLTPNVILHRLNRLEIRCVSHGSAKRSGIPFSAALDNPWSQRGLQFHLPVIGVAGFSRRSNVGKQLGYVMRLHIGYLNVSHQDIMLLLVSLRPVTFLKSLWHFISDISGSHQTVIGVWAPLTGFWNIL